MSNPQQVEDRIEQAIAKAYEEIDSQLPEEERVPFSRATPLYGKGGHLDSLALVNFVIAAEKSIEQEFGLFVALADEKALSQKRSPYRTVESFIAYSSKIVRESESVG